MKLEKYHYVTLVGWIARTLSMLLSLINARFLLELVDVDGYAVYSIATSLIGWVALLNYGLPSGVQNIIAKYRVSGKALDKIYANLLFIISFILLLFVPLLYGVSYFVYESVFIEYQQYIHRGAIFLVLCLFLFFGLAQIFYKILFAQHKGIYPNVYPAIVSFMGFMILYTLRVLDVYNVSIVLVLFFIPHFIIFVFSFIQSVGFIRPKFDKEITLELYHASKHFFIFAILAICALGVDYFIMSRILTSLEITRYNLVMRIYGILTISYATLLSSSWAMSAELHHKNNPHAILSMVKKNLLVGFLLVLGASAILFVLKDYVFHLLSGKEGVIVGYSTLIFATVYILVRIWTDTFAMILSSMEKVKILICVLPFQAIVSIVGQYFLGRIFKENGILIGLSLSFVLTVAFILPLYLRKRLKYNYE